jgi:thymidine kinase
MVGALMINPQFIIFTGPMFGGKTTRLLSALDRYVHQKRDVLAFKPDVDKRYGEESINTHTGGKISAIRVSSGKEITTAVLEKVETGSADIIAVDEAFMIPGSAKALIELFNKGFTVLISTLQLCSDGTSYEEIKEMMPWATKIEICPAVCTTCGADAFYTFKKGGNSHQQIEVGGSDLYEPRCLKHFEF